jgi:hypothetical protein
MTDEECKDLILKTNRLLEDINIQLASLNLIFYGDIMPSFIKTNFSNKNVSVNNFSLFFLVFKKRITIHRFISSLSTAEWFS